MHYDRLRYYCRSLGYRYTNGAIEKQDQYLKRMTGVTRLYSAILITPLRQHASSVAHPHGIENGWIWMSNFLNLPPIPDICATMLLEFLTVAGVQMWSTYRQQFQKLLLTMHQQYIPLLDKVSAAGARPCALAIGHLVGRNIWNSSNSMIRYRLMLAVRRHG